MFRNRKIFFKKFGKKSVGTLYMIITYLNKPYILHYCKLSRLYGTKLRWPTTAIHKYLLYYCILYLSTQTYSLAARVYLPVQ